MSAQDCCKAEIIRVVIHLSELKRGHTVEIDGKTETVNASRISEGFMGWTYNGQQFRNGITRVIFKVPVKDGFRFE